MERIHTFALKETNPDGDTSSLNGASDIPKLENESETSIVKEEADPSDRFAKKDSTASLIAAKRAFYLEERVKLLDTGIKKTKLVLREINNILADFS